MTTNMTAREERTVLRAVLRAPWSRRTWLATAHVAAGFPIGVLTTVLVVFLGTLTVGLAPFWGLGLVLLALLLRCARAFTALQRSRFAAFLGVLIPAVPDPPAGENWRRRVFAEARTPAVRRQLAYHLLAGFVSSAGIVVVTAAWTVGIVFGTVAAYTWALPAGSTFVGKTQDPFVLVVLTMAGLICLFAAPWVVHGVVALDAIAARALLGPSRSENLAHRVEKLAKSRAAVVDAADAERRRIERDLHDGTQQRLTSLAMNLGMARETLDDVAGPVREVIVQAHEDAKQALTELRGFVRGLHPAVLENRGLDAALSGIIARSPVPVRLTVDIQERPSATIEAVAYFVVSEALTNVAKHARASQVEIVVRRCGDELRVHVADDGQGGAKADAGTGLRGLAQRVGSVDGTLRVDSPPGGPTLITVELPCES